MIDNIEIHNFKSITDLKIPLGRINVIVGPNGCGKSNILEAISFASAAAQNKLDNEYLVNRDVRVTDPKFMVNAFEEDEDLEDENAPEGGVPVPSIGIKVVADNGTMQIICDSLYVDDLKQWVNVSDGTVHIINKVLSDPEKYGNDTDKVIEALRSAFFPLVKDSLQLKELVGRMMKPYPEFNNFLTYRPTEHFLRKTFESTLYPLGVHGEGLLKYLKESAEHADKELFAEINDGLRLLDWFDGFRIPEDLMTNEYRLSIGDRYLKDSLHYFDQRSTNEGFLFLLFYLTLFNSKDTPAFFAIDNIETALNPKLMTKLTEYLIKRSFENGKQIILTTHSPFVLDALDLANSDIRLFVARRDIEGHTRLEQIPYREDRTMKLSQLWMSGLIGGLPDNF